VPRNETQPVQTPHAQSLDEIARAYVLLVLALGERDPDSLDFAVVPAAVRAKVHASYPTLDTIRQEAESLHVQIQTLEAQGPVKTNHGVGDEEARDRAAFLSVQLSALVARTAMLRGHLLPFDQEARALFDVSVLPNRSFARRSMVRQQVEAMLSPTTVHVRTPADRYTGYQQRFLVPEGRLRVVMQSALAACRQQTVAHLSLPAGESVDLEFVHNQPWRAFSRYQGNGHSTIQLNLDLPVTVDEVLELACHEGYPGHHVMNTLRDVALAQGKGWPETQVQPTFSPQSYVTEAAAAFAPRLAFSLPERIRLERDVLFPLAGLPAGEAARYVTICELMRELSSAEPPIARAYLDGNLDFVRAAEALQHELLMSHAEPLLLYLNEYRSYMLAYTDGPERVREFVGLRGSPATAGTEPHQQPSEDLEERTRAWKQYQDLVTQLVYRLPAPSEEKATSR